MLRILAAGAALALSVASVAEPAATLTLAAASVAEPTATLTLAATAEPTTATLPACDAGGCPSGAAAAAERAVAVSSSA